LVAATEQGVGVSFGLSDEQKALRELAREFAANEIRPLERECDEHMRHPVDVIGKAHALGLMNVHVPEAYGGPELSAFDGMLVGEELYWGCAGIGTSITANGLGAVGVARAAYEHAVAYSKERVSRSTCRSQCTRA
jgi:acyl-CoA dehydrogenase